MSVDVRTIKTYLATVGKILSEAQEAENSWVNEKEARHELLLEELRIIYSRLDEALSTAKTRILTFLGAGLALLSYLYGSGSLFIPEQRYGVVLYFIGLGLVIAGMGFLLRGLRTSFWSVPLETKLLKMHRYKTHLELLEELIDEYTECLTSNIVRYEAKVSSLNSGFFSLLCGAILLLVIKNIGG